MTDPQLELDKVQEMDFISLKHDKLKNLVRESIFDAIKKGYFPNGKLPTETKLAKMLGVSRATINTTLAYMEREGIVVRRHGSATYINKYYADIKAQITDGVGVYDLIEKCGYQPSLRWNKTVELGAAELPPYIAEKLALNLEERAVRISRLFCADGNPAVYVEEYIPCSRLKKSIENEKLPETIYKLAEEYCKSTIDFTIVDIVPCVPEDGITRYFDLDPNSGILLSEELHLDKNSNPLVCSKVYTYDKYIRYRAIRIRK